MHPYIFYAEDLVPHVIFLFSLKNNKFLLNTIKQYYVWDSKIFRSLLQTMYKKNSVTV